MQKIQFAKFNPGSGRGDKKMAITADEHTGRSLRTISAEVVALEGDSRQSLIVEQEAEEEFTTLDAAATVSGDGGKVTINGRSNSDKLTFTLQIPSSNPIDAELPEVYYIEGIELPNRIAIPGDPGLYTAFDFSVNVNVKDNRGRTDLSGTLIVTDGAGNKAACVINQPKDDVFLEVPTSVVNLKSNGEPITFDIYSNAAWRIKAAMS